MKRLKLTTNEVVLVDGTFSNITSFKISKVEPFAENITVERLEFNVALTDSASFITDKCFVKGVVTINRSNNEYDTNTQQLSQTQRTEFEWNIHNQQPCSEVVLLVNSEDTISLRCFAKGFGDIVGQEVKVSYLLNYSVKPIGTNFASKKER